LRWFVSRRKQLKRHRCSGGVYTKEQAARGQARYFAAYGRCHGGLLEVVSERPQRAGIAFVKRRGDHLFALASVSNADRNSRRRDLSCPGVRDAINDAQRLEVSDGKGQISTEVSAICRAIGRNWL
jgi:hypothetical protein